MGCVDRRVRIPAKFLLLSVASLAIAACGDNGPTAYSGDANTTDNDLGVQFDVFSSDLTTRDVVGVDTAGDLSRADITQTDITQTGQTCADAPSVSAAEIINNTSLYADRVVRVWSVVSATQPQCPFGDPVNTPECFTCAANVAVRSGNRAIALSSPDPDQQLACSSDQAFNPVCAPRQHGCESLLGLERELLVSPMSTDEGWVLELLDDCPVVGSPGEDSAGAPAAFNTWTMVWHSLDWEGVGPRIEVTSEGELRGWQSVPAVTNDNVLPPQPDFEIALTIPAATTLRNRWVANAPINQAQAPEGDRDAPAEAPSCEDSLTLYECWDDACTFDSWGYGYGQADASLAPLFDWFEAVVLPFELGVNPRWSCSQ
ncbi:MAG: hypothetical protein KC561_02995 [Myxococcales bacterium]|nr:hypothetical protein [Myxococcales bacterium]